jgi:tetratricopeptide (TPR) repeat protein
LLVETPDRHGLRFRHALIREALYDEVVLPRRRALHRRVAEALEATTHPDPDAVAHHFVQAADARAAVWLIEAGRRAARRDAARDAITRFTAALDLLPDEPVNRLERGWLLWELAEVFRFSDPPRAHDYLDEAERIVAATGDAGLAAVVRWTRVRMRGILSFPILNDLEEALAAFEALPAVDRARAESVAYSNAPSRGILAQWAAQQGRYDIAVRAAEAGIAAGAGATRPGQICAVADALSGLGLAHAGLRRPIEASETFGRAVTQYKAVGNRSMACWALRWQIDEVAIPYLADLPGTRRRLAESFAELFPDGDEVPQGADGRPLMPLFGLAFVEGDWAAAEQVAQEYGEAKSWRLDSVGTLAEIERARGRRHEAWARVQQGLPAGPATEPGSIFYLRRLPIVRLAVELALDEGRLETAGIWLEIYERWLDHGGRVLGRATARLLHARLHLLRGERTADSRPRGGGGGARGGDPAAPAARPAGGAPLPRRTGDDRG